MKKKEGGPKAFPRYDDAEHMDSAAIAPHPEKPHHGDPAATEYTERYFNGADR